MKMHAADSQLNKLLGLFFVLALHMVILYGAWSYKLIPPPHESVTLFVNLITPPPTKTLEPPTPEPPKPPPQKVKLEKPPPLELTKPEPILVSNAAVSPVTEPTAPLPPVIPAPTPVAPALPVVEAKPEPPTSVMLSSELSVACPKRSLPEYPAMSRRRGEQGHVVLRVELDETGRITSARVSESSGFPRLDEAGLSAIKHWQCNAATQDGMAVRAVALQPFDFILEGR
jgi:periplasmic protein TonB